MNIDLKISPKNLLEWSDMEDWDAGASAAPSEHTLSGSGASVAREATIIKKGTYSAAVTRVGNDATLYHDFVDYADYAGRKMTFGAWVYATVASRARLSINDGVGSSNSSYHTGDSTWQFLTVTRNIDASATQIRCGMEVNTGNTTAYFDGGILAEGTLTFTDLYSSFINVEDMSPDRKLRISKYQISRRAGVLIPSVQYGERMIMVKGKVYGTTQANARSNYDTLLQAVNDGEKDIYYYDDRFIRCFLASDSNKPRAASRIIDFDLRFTPQDPFFYYIQKLRSKQTISASPTTFTVTTGGTAYTLPLLQFAASGNDITSCTLENLTTGQTMTFTGTVTDGDTLKIDCHDLTVLNDGVDQIGSFSGDFIKLLPGGNEIKFTGSNCIIKVDWRDKWL